MSLHGRRRSFVSYSCHMDVMTCCNVFVTVHFFSRQSSRDTFRKQNKQTRLLASSWEVLHLSSLSEPGINVCSNISMLITLQLGSSKWRRVKIRKWLFWKSIIQGGRDKNIKYMNFAYKSRNFCDLWWRVELLCRAFTMHQAYQSKAKKKLFSVCECDLSRFGIRGTSEIERKKTTRNAQICDAISEMRLPSTRNCALWVNEMLQWWITCANTTIEEFFFSGKRIFASKIIFDLDHKKLKFWTTKHRPFFYDVIKTYSGVQFNSQVYR